MRPLGLEGCARRQVLGALPRDPARGTPPETPGPLFLLSHLPERSSPSRVRFAAQKQRALDRSGPFRTRPMRRKSGRMQTFSICGFAINPKLHTNFAVDKTS